jgi:hypothetical protein
MRGRGVKKKEKAEIREKFRNGAKVHVLAEEHHLSARTIYRIISETRRGNKKKGRKNALTSAQRRSLVRKSHEKPLLSAAELAKSLHLPVTPQTIRNELKRNEFRHERLKPTEAIRPANMEKRLVFARNYVTWTKDQWAEVIFTDEKKWNLVGNDGFVSAWVDNRSEFHREEVQRLRQSVMTWGAISAEKGLVIVRIEEKIDGPTYCEMLESCFFDSADVVLPPNFLFQQDNASAHVCRHTMAFLESREISVFSWPPQSPDLSPIEDIWGIVSEKVYKHGKTYQTKDDLWKAIVAAWDSIPRSTFQNLYKSMNNRLIKVLESNGRRIRH